MGKFFYRLTIIFSLYFILVLAILLGNINIDSLEDNLVTAHYNSYLLGCLNHGGSASLCNKEAVEYIIELNRTTGLKIPNKLKNRL
jgi:hypothetical protein